MGKFIAVIGLTFLFNLGAMILVAFVDGALSTNLFDNKAALVPVQMACLGLAIYVVVFRKPKKAEEST
jgi:hypothetical protein